MGGDLKINNKPIEHTSNFSIEYPFIYNNLKWLSVEQCFQAQKFNGEIPDKKTYYEIHNSNDLNEWITKGNWGKLRNDWEDIKVLMMKNIVLAKINQNLDLMDIIGKLPIEDFEEGQSFWGKENPKIWNEIKKFIQKNHRLGLMDKIL